MEFEFTADVSFMSVPILPPTISNCEKCCFHLYLCGYIGDYSVCEYGQNGYFSNNDKIKCKIVKEAEE
jgi:hypothetical protein